ncbi:MAG: endo alpha-1,4 polygalactosaminidase [Candidatus Magnetomorum sp.]|nr:endo alpha-1,4 polygalactosaminidase [Candidatus Magnetomorum sp.]
MQKTLIICIVILSISAQCLYAQKPLKKVKTWGYWLQAPDISVIAACPYDLLVIDYSFDGTDTKAFTTEHMDRLHRADKHMLSYLSIGEAESYRFYWKKEWKTGSPDFIGTENSDWAGNFKVKYWNKQWWDQALKPYLNRILSAGFDGVYLDIIDAYYYWSQNGYPVQHCADQMIALVVSIREYVSKKGKKTFTICPQNALGIIGDASLMPKKRYLKAIDAIGVESLFFNYWSLEDQTYRLKCIREFYNAKKRIFNVEYLKKEQWKTYHNTLHKQPFPIIGYAAHENRALKELIVPSE